MFNNRFRNFLPRRNKQPRRRVNRYRRTLAMESLEPRQMLSITPLQAIASSGNTGEKPQSKLFEYAGQWWTVMPHSSGTSVFRLDGTSWTATQQITSSSGFRADVKLVGDVAHVLLLDAGRTQLASLQYDPADNRFEPWSLRPQLVSVPLPSSTESATLEVDSTGRMWIAYDVSSTVEVRYSDGLYTTWSTPITVASGINSDDISAIIAMPNNTVGVMWSNQSTDRFGFRVHVDGTAPNIWSADEVPASQSALRVGGGMADDHLNLAVTSDGTLYAAVKTSYDKSGYPSVALLVRRPNGVWDDLYTVSNSGTRPIVVVNEAAGKLIVAYTSATGGGNILYRESPLGNISFGPIGTLISGNVNNVTSTKYTSTNEIVFLASTRGALFRFDTSGTNLAPSVNAGPDRSIQLGNLAVLDGTVTDDGQPTPAALTTSWSKISGPGSVTFANSSAVDTTASFSAIGSYVLRLTASDGQLTAFDDMVVTVTSSSAGDPPPGGQTGGGSGNALQMAFQNGLFPNASYAGTIDTQITSKKPTQNLGSSTTFVADGSPDIAALLKWDVSAIPSGSIVVSAAIELNATTTTKSSYEVYALQRAWDELSATWQQYAAGEAWNAAGANGAGDHAAEVLGQVRPTKKGIYRMAFNEAGVAAVQAWINNPESNYGIILKNYTPPDGITFSSSEATKAHLRPKLIIEYETNSSVASNAVSETAPIVDVGPDRTASRGQPLQLQASITRNGQPMDLTLLNILWTAVSGPTTVSFTSPTSLNTNVTFSQAGSYTLRLTVSDGLLSSFDELLVTVT